MNLPFVTVQFRAPDVRVPQLRMPDVRLPAPRVSREEVDAAVKTARSYLPPPREMAYYGGLALMAVFELIEWPVAAAMGFGTVILRSSRGDSHERASSSSAEKSQRK